MTDRATGATTMGIRHPRKACVNCHFFQAAVRAGEAGPPPGIVSEEHRRMARDNNFAWAPVDTATTWNILGCHMGVWVEGFQPNLPKTDRYERIVARDRKRSCFFWPYDPDMRVEAAETLERRQSEAWEAARDRRHVIRGLQIAAAGLWVAIAVGIGQIVATVWAAIRTAPAVAASEKPTGRTQKAPPIPARLEAPTSPSVDPRTSPPAPRSK